MALSKWFGRFGLAMTVALSFATAAYAGGSKPPVVTITSPADGSGFASGTPITFTGTAMDREDGVLTDSLAWTSSIDGPMGTGGSCTATLSVGTHTITASVTDSSGKTGSDAITVTVQGVLSIDAVDIVAPANPSAVPQYDRVELLVTLSGVNATKFYEPDPGRDGVDLYAVFTPPGSSEPLEINGFYDGSSWRIRFAPDRAGAWTFQVKARDKSRLEPAEPATWTGGSFTCVTSSHPGWARIDGHYLRFSEGQVLFAVGHNTGWQDGPNGVEEPALADMASRGENLLSFWLATPWDVPSWGAERAARAPIENSEGHIGNYNQAACAYIDSVVARAEAAGVCLLPSIWSHGQLRTTGHPWGEGWWDNNAYNEVCAAADFFKTGGTEQWRLQRNFYRYLIARWGYSRAVAGWVGLCEIDGTTGYYNAQTRPDAEAWCVAVRDYFRANDPFRANAGGKYPIAFTKLNAAAWGDGDLQATDNYTQQNNDTEVAAAIGGDTEIMQGSPTVRACLHAEFGGDTLNGASQPAHLHNGIWAGTCAGAAMTPLVWCDGGNFPMLTPAMQDHLEYLSQFVGGIGYLGDANLGPATVVVKDSQGEDDPHCRGWGMKLADRGYVWIQNTAGTLGGQKVKISTVDPTKSYVVVWYDVWASGGNPLAVTDDVTPINGDLSVDVPILQRWDIACRFAPGPREPNYPPLAYRDEATTNEDNENGVSIDVLANDTDADAGTQLTVTSLTQPANGTATLDAEQKLVTYTPNVDFYGIDSFTYTANDGQTDGNVATVTITVNNVNDPPVANDDTTTTSQDTPVTIDVLANDTDVDGDALTVDSVTQAANGSVLNNGDTVTYTPDPGFAGEDSFGYTTSDGNGGTDTATVAVTVTAGPPPNIYGSITSADSGSGIGGITVKLEQKKGKNWNNVQTTTTDDDGYYQFAGLKRGTYRVTPQSPQGQSLIFTPPSAEIRIDGPDDLEVCDFVAE